MLFEKAIQASKGMTNKLTSFSQKVYIFFILLAKAVISKLNGIKFKNTVYVKRKY